MPLASQRLLSTGYHTLHSVVAWHPLHLPTRSFPSSKATVQFVILRAARMLRGKVLFFLNTFLELLSGLWNKRQAVSL